MESAGVEVESKAAPATPSGVVLAVGQRWKEVHKRKTRIVEVKGWTDNGHHVDVVDVETGRRTLISIERFTGTKARYSLVSTHIS